MRKKIECYIRAGYSGLYVISHEEARVEAEIKAVCNTVGFTLHVWDVANGIVSAAGVPVPDTADPVQMLEAFAKLPEKSLLLAKDIHLFLGDPNPMVIRRVKDAVRIGKTSNRVLLALGCQLKLVPELEKEITVIEFKLPDRDARMAVIKGVADSAAIAMNGNTEALLDASAGGTTIEIENWVSMAVVEGGGKEIDPTIVGREKAKAVKKGGILEIVETPMNLEDIGGLDNYKQHLVSIRHSFSRAAKEYGLPSPRPALLCGQAGTGKSMMAMATGNIFKLPLIRLEAGRLFASHVGESEANWRSAFATAKAIAPAIFWCDEAEALFAGLQSSGQTDGGTSARVIKAILQDMQMNGDGLFFVFTANDIDMFPDPLIDRCDVWSFELPSEAERESIWQIHIAKRNRKPDAYDISAFAKSTDGFSGRQIEQVWIKAMTTAFNDGQREPVNDDVQASLKEFVPTSVTMKDAIEKRRARLQHRAKPASPAVASAKTAARKFNVGLN